MKTTLYTRAIFGCLGLLVCLAIGCKSEKRPDGLPPLYPLTLVVKQEGQPLADATVQLIDAGASGNWSTGGKTDSTGTVQVTTYGKFQGAPLGKYKVTVSKTINEGEEEYIAAMNRNDAAAAAKVTVNSYVCVQPKYMTSAQTPIEIEVTKSTKTLDIDAGPAVKTKQPYLK